MVVLIQCDACLHKQISTSQTIDNLSLKFCFQMNLFQKDTFSVFFITVHYSAHAKMVIFFKTIHHSYGFKIFIFFIKIRYPYQQKYSCSQDCRYSLSTSIKDTTITFNQTKISGIYTLRPRQNGRYFPDEIFTFICLHDSCCILNQISLKVVLKGTIKNQPTLV